MPKANLLLHRQTPTPTKRPTGNSDNSCRKTIIFSHVQLFSPNRVLRILRIHLATSAVDSLVFFLPLVPGSAIKRMAIYHVAVVLAFWCERQFCLWRIP